MKIEYVPKNFTAGSLTVIENANKIIDDYTAQGYQLTLRQLYYQFVATDLLENTTKSYNRLGSIINDARLAGLVDWNAIEDRTRNLVGPSHWDSPAQILHSAAAGFALDKWEGQEYRVEAWVEKEALAGVVERTCDRLDIDSFACRGYVSQSAMWEAAQRLQRYIRAGQRVVILHLGDHDPSGMDMTRDIRDRLAIFGLSDGFDLRVERIALNMDQVRQYNPPPNPAKLTDSRCAGYLDEYGTKSWELDALEPRVLNALIENHVADLRQDIRYNEMKARETHYKARLAEVADNTKWED
jgi:hypothetical protein